MWNWLTIDIIDQSGVSHSESSNFVSRFWFSSFYFLFARAIFFLNFNQMFIPIVFQSYHFWNQSIICFVCKFVSLISYESYVTYLLTSIFLGFFRTSILDQFFRTFFYIWKGDFSPSIELIISRETNHFFFSSLSFPSPQNSPQVQLKSIKGFFLFMDQSRHSFIWEVLRYVYR